MLDILGLLFKLKNSLAHMKIKKKIFIFSTLFALGLLTVPQVTYADGFWSGFFSGAFGGFGGAGGGSSSGFGMLGNLFAWLFVIVPCVIINLVFYIFCWVGSHIFSFAVTRLIIDTAGQWRITTQPIFVTGWITSRNLANMLILLAVIGIAVATILRFRDYEAKKLLLPVIVVALLINFSNVFCGLFIDTSNVIMKDFAGLTVADEESTMLSRVVNVENQATNWAPVLTQTFEQTVGQAIRILEFAMIYLMMGVVFIYVTIMLIARYAILGILFILSPLAFVFRVFPGIIPDTKKIWTSWWEHFLKWSFVGIGICFTLYLSVSMLLLVGFNAQNNIPTIEFDLAVVVMILFVGTRITTKASGYITSTAMATGAIALGSYGRIFSGLGKVLGATRAGEAVKNVASSAYNNVRYGVTKAGEATGLAKQGQANLNYQNTMAAKVKEHEQFAEADAKEAKRTGDWSKIKKAAENSNDGSKRAAYVNVLQKNKRGGTIDPTKRQQAMDDLATHGVDNSEFVKSDPTLVRYDRAKTSELKSKNKQRGGEDSTQYEKRIGNLAVVQAVQKANPSNAKEWSKDTLQDPNVTRALDLAKIKAIGRGGSQEAKDEVIKAYATQNGRTDLLRLARIEHGKNTPEYAREEARILKTAKHILADKNGDFNMPGSKVTGSKNSMNMSKLSNLPPP